MDWKPYVAAGRLFYDILEIASGYDHAAHAALADASEDAASRGTFAKAKELIANDRAAVKALARFADAADFMLDIAEASGESNASFSTSALFTVHGGVVVMSPQPFNRASGNAEIQVNGRPIRLHERDEEDAASRGRVEIALLRAPDIEGCEPDATVCAAGTTMRARGVKLELKQNHRIERTPTRWRLWPADDAG